MNPGYSTGVLNTLEIKDETGDPSCLILKNKSSTINKSTACKENSDNKFILFRVSCKKNKYSTGKNPYRYDTTKIWWIQRY